MKKVNVKTFISLAQPSRNIFKRLIISGSYISTWKAELKMFTDDEAFDK